jgi:hypothetical protein
VTRDCDDDDDNNNNNNKLANEDNKIISLIIYPNIRCDYR